MYSTVTTVALDQCITYLEGLLQDNTPERTKNAWYRCCDGLRVMMGKWESYIQKITTAECFLRFFSENIDNMLSCRACFESDKSVDYTEKLEDIVFAITEEMAVLMREHCLRTGPDGISDEERKIMDFFETSGLWFLGDGTLVSEYYYVKLPTQIIADYVRQIEKRIV